MRGKELLKLVWTNLMQNKFKVVLTSIGIVVGAATIVMVIAIGRGGQMEVAEQFKNLNAGAIDISYELSESTQGEKGFGGGMSFPGGGQMPGGGMPPGNMPGGAVCQMEIVHLMEAAKAQAVAVVMETIKMWAAAA